MTASFKRRSRTGFTLVEVLVAILIFAIMSAVAYRALGAVLEGRERLDRDVRKWRELSLLFARMKQDFLSAAPRPVLDPGGLTVPAFAAGYEPLRAFDAPLVFSRAGETALDRAPAAPQRIGYRLRGNAVELLVWPVLDQAPRTVAAAVPLLDGVAELQFRYLPPAGEWQESWPPATRSAVLPSAVQVTLRLESGERIVRVFALPALGGAS